LDYLGVPIDARSEKPDLSTRSAEHADQALRLFDHLAGTTTGEEQFEAAWRCGRSLALLGRYDDALDAFAFAQHALRGMHPSDTRPGRKKGQSLIHLIHCVNRRAKPCKQGLSLFPFPDNPGGTGPIIHDNESTKIGITQPFPLAAKDGDTFPLMLDGNFKTGDGGGPGGGTAAFPVWGVKVAKDETPRAYFDADPVRTGFTIPANASTLGALVSVTVHPATDADNVDFQVSGEDRVDIEVIDRDSQTGIIIIKVLGTSGTPDSQPNGDTLILATMDSTTIGQADAIVVVPARIESPAAKGQVDAKKLNLSPITSPADHSVPAGFVQRVVAYLHILELQVYDQFDDNLHEVYTDIEVFEDFGNGATTINQKIRSGGVYSDPVGTSIQWDGPIRETLPAAINWPTDPLPTPIPHQTLTQPGGNFNVVIGGHALQMGPRLLETEIAEGGATATVEIDAATANR